MNTVERYAVGKISQTEMTEKQVRYDEAIAAIQTYIDHFHFAD
jgi:outer membrane protein TolC